MAAASPSFDASTGERLTALETDRKHLATRADLEAMKSELIKWIVGIGLLGAGVIATIISVVIGLLLRVT